MEAIDKFCKGNISWLFTKEYYNQQPMEGDRGAISLDYVPLVNTLESEVITIKEEKKKLKDEIKAIKKENGKILAQKSKWLCEKKWADFKKFEGLLSGENKLIAPNASFELKVENPGLVFGTGITHESGNEGEFKIGFYFDFITGLIVIPGHAIKGVVKSWFVGNDKREALLWHLKNDKGDLRELGKNIESVETTIDNGFLEKLCDEMFSGKDTEGIVQNIYRRDIFHEAFIVGSDHTGGLFLGKDAITPHGTNPLRNPIPLPFIKLLPRTKLIFNFRFKKGILDVKQKEQLVKYLIKEYGIGAKTNVGYGQFK